MKTLTWINLFPALLALVFVAGCATPESRIRDNPETFNRLTQDQQTLIKKGQVALGFDTEMVKLAVGEPDHIRERTDASGTTEVWGYTTYENDDGMLLYRGYYHRYRRDLFAPYYDSFPLRRTHDYLRITLKDGKVIAIDKAKDW